MFVSSKVEPKDLREAAKVARTWRYYVWKPIAEHHFIVFAIAFVTLLLANLTGRSHTSWRDVAILGDAAVGIWIVQRLGNWIMLEHRIRKANSGFIDMEFKAGGVYFHKIDGSQTVMRWDRFYDTRAGKGVLILIFRRTKRKNLRRRGYLVVSTRTLSPAEKQELLLAIPEDRRGKSVIRELRKWRLT